MSKLLVQWLLKRGCRRQKPIATNRHLIAEYVCPPYRKHAFPTDFGLCHSYIFIAEKYAPIDALTLSHQNFGTRIYSQN